MVDNFASEHTEPEWNNAILMVLNSLKKSLFVILGENCVFATMEEGCDLGIQILDVLAGPF